MAIKPSKGIYLVNYKEKKQDCTLNESSINVQLFKQSFLLSLFLEHDGGTYS